MLPSDMNLHIKTETVRYSNKILMSHSKFNLGKNDNVNTLLSIPKISHRPTITHAQKQTITHAQKQTITHEDEKVALVLSLAGGFMILVCFSIKNKTKPTSGCSVSRFATWDFNLASLH